MSFSHLTRHSLGQLRSENAPKYISEFFYIRNYEITKGTKDSKKIKNSGTIMSSSSWHHGWQYLPDHIFGDIMMMINLQKIDRVLSRVFYSYERQDKFADRCRQVWFLGVSLRWRTIGGQVQTGEDRCGQV